MIFAQDGDHDNEDPQAHEESVHEEDDDEDNSSNVSDEDVEKKDDSKNDPKHSNKSFIDMEFKMHSAYSEESIIEQSLKYWKKQGNIAANTLRGVVNHFPPAPNANEVGPSDAEQSIYATELEEWRKACKEHNAAILQINDTHIGMCDSNITKKLEVEYTVAVLEDRRRGHVLNPLVLLKSIVRIANGVTKQKKRELLLILEREIQQLKDAGQLKNETFDGLRERWKALYSRLTQINVDTAEDIKVDRFFLSVNKNRYPELVQHYAAMMRKKPEEANEQSFEYRVWSQSYKDLIASTLEEACEKAKDYKPEIKFLTRDDSQSQFAAQDKKNKSQHKDIPTQQGEKGECLICFSKDHNGFQCPFLGRCQEYAKQRLANKTAASTSTENSIAYTMIDWYYD